MLESETLTRLHELVKPGDTVYTAIRQVSSNGMSRHINVHIVRGGRILTINRLVAAVTGFKISPKTDALIVGGAGMDMGFYVVYSLSRAMFREGFKCTGSAGGGHYTASGAYVQPKVPRCPSSDHSNDYGRLSREFDEANPEIKAKMERGGMNTQEEIEHAVAARQTWIAEQDKACYSKRRVHSDGGYALSHSWI